MTLAWLPLLTLLTLLSGADTTAAPRGTAELALAASVAAWAREARDVDAMMAAAELLQASEGAGLADAQGSRDIDAAALFDEAASLAQDADGAARVLARRSAHPRGVSRALGGAGPIGRLIQVSPTRPLSFALTARGGEQALLHVGPTGGGDLEVVVVDDRGRTLCRQRAPGRPVLCDWRPAFTTTYRVNIRVVSAVAVTTVITSN